jgi:hypothetical protein
MPRSRHATVPDSNTEIIEEVVTSHWTTQGTKIEKTWVPAEQPVYSTTNKSSTSQSKPKNQGNTSRVEEEIHDTGDNNIVQADQFIGDEDIPPVNISEDTDPQAIVSLWDLPFDVPNSLQSPMDQWLQRWSTYLNMLLDMEGQLCFSKCSICSTTTSAIAIPLLASMEWKALFPEISI